MTANTRQVGGSHYKVGSLPEHWDLVVQYDWDYFQGQIIKYVMRHKKKNGVQDLQKAAHFLEKYIEEQTKLSGQPVRSVECSTTGEVHSPSQELPEYVPVTAVMDNATKQFVNQGGNDWWQNEGYYGDTTCLYSCRRCKKLVRQVQAPLEPHSCAQGGAPTPAAAQAPDTFDSSLEPSEQQR